MPIERHRKHPQTPSSYIVTMECVVRKSVVVDNCTREQAQDNPWDCNVVEETELEQIDWKVLKVEHNV